MVPFPQKCIDQVIMIILLCQNTTVVGHTVSQPSRDLKELYSGRTHKYENDSPKILVSIYAAECELFFCLSDLCPVNKSVCCLRELDREIESQRRKKN